MAASLRGFALAYDAVTQRRAQQAIVEAALQPAPRRTCRALGRARVASYQDEAYAQLYEQRLDRFSDPAIRAELARWLALWMAFDDIVRVAALKLVSSRQDRVRREAKVGDDELLKVYDHFKPGVPEFAALLPHSLATRLQAWDRRRIAAGREPWALPLKVGTHTVLGTLALRFVAALKGQRRRGSRFALEQALIERWLDAVALGEAPGPGAGPGAGEVRPPDQGLRQHQRTRQGEPAAHHLSTWPAATPHGARRARGRAGRRRRPGAGPDLERPRGSETPIARAGGALVPSATGRDDPGLKPHNEETNR